MLSWRDVTRYLTGGHADTSEGNTPEGNHMKGNGIVPSATSLDDLNNERLRRLYLDQMRGYPKPPINDVILQGLGIGDSQSSPAATHVGVSSDAKGPLSNPYNMLLMRLRMGSIPKSKIDALHIAVGPTKTHLMIVKGDEI